MESCRHTPLEETRNTWHPKKLIKKKVNLLLKRTCHKRTKRQTEDEKNMDILFFFLINLDLKR